MVYVGYRRLALWDGVKVLFEYLNILIAKNLNK